MDDPTVAGDRVQLQQVIFNLIINATEAMHTVNNRQRELRIQTTVDSNAVHVSVEDTGTGLGKESLGRIFHPFYTTKSDGIGMGLSISRSVIEAHGGRLWAESRSPHGAVFRFSPPWVDGAQMTDRQPLVFVIADDTSTRKTLSSLIRSMRLQVQLFASAEGFLKCERPDTDSCLALDIRLRGMRGARFSGKIGRLRHLHPGYLHHWARRHPDRETAWSEIRWPLPSWRGQTSGPAGRDPCRIGERPRETPTKRGGCAVKVQVRIATPGERQVLPLLVSGMLSKQIAAGLGISEASTKVHRSQLMRKMHAESLPDSVRMAEKMGLPLQCNSED